MNLDSKKFVVEVRNAGWRRVMIEGTGKPASFLMYRDALKMAKDFANKTGNTTRIVELKTYEVGIVMIYPDEWCE